MSPLIIGTATAALLISMLALYGFTQAMQSLREERQRMVNMLLARTDNFQDLLSAFPPCFLPAELRQLVASSLMETWQRLCAIDPKNLRYREAEQRSAQLLQKLGKETAGTRAPLETPAAVKEAKQHLKTLGKYLQQQIAGGKLSAQQAKQFTAQLQNLHVQIGLDGHNLAIRQHCASKHYSLAAHHCELARKLLLKQYNPASATLLQHYDSLHDNLSAKSEMLATGIDPDAVAARPEKPADAAQQRAETASTELVDGATPKKKISMDQKKHDYD